MGLTSGIICFYNQTFFHQALRVCPHKNWEFNMSAHSSPHKNGATEYCLLKPRRTDHWDHCLKQKNNNNTRCKKVWKKCWQKALKECLIVNFMHLNVFPLHYGSWDGLQPHSNEEKGLRKMPFSEVCQGLTPSCKSSDVELTCDNCKVWSIFVFR